MSDIHFNYLKMQELIINIYNTTCDEDIQEKIYIVLKEMGLSDI